ncbi:DUF1828 domain-containing protein [Schleiferilactobacillus perolens]|jgi:hypothetical protein|uniref:DUF1828 domain-containing protein n=1 Tax=Schleiferilactobacillus perolens TaxID=100468 RepID=UPI002352EBF5|nr:DUF1828 domain-containing protein [Schleiferilactobacillus perolens]MCI2169956.1 DUF1828 domain-containing protein [Schleiferilactobacillus perolens]
MANIDDANEIAKDWLQSVQASTKFTQIDDNNIVFHSGFVNPSEDEVTLLISALNDGQFMVTDQGYTIWDLETQGIEIAKKEDTRSTLLNGIIHNNQVNFDHQASAIFAQASRQKLPEAINHVLSAVLKVSDLAYIK